MRAADGVIGLMRVNNMIICALSVACGGILSGKPAEVASAIAVDAFDGRPERALGILSAAFSAATILAAGNVLNDLMDMETDRINAPGRPLPSGRVSRKTALITAVTLFICGLAASVLLGLYGILTASTAALLLVLYDIRLKSVPFAGNAAVALLGGLAFVYGGIAGGCVTEALIPALFATLIHLGREIIKDCEDIEGDTAVGITTLATTCGVRCSCRIAAFVLALLMIATAVPVFGWFGWGYAVIIAAGVWPPVLYAISLAFRTPEKKRLTLVSRLLKLGMTAGLLAVLAGFQGL